jgi:asparagine synthase (glutamine-hydrolysing)
VFRYVAFVWDAADEARCEAAQALIGRLQSAATEWWCALRQNGLAVFYAGARPGSSEAYALNADAGVVLGKLFTRSLSGYSSASPLTLSAQESANILATGGRHLIDHYWGRYVAFLRDVATDTVWVLRDPTATLPCESISVSGVNIYFSWLEDVECLALKAFSVDWRYVAAALCHMRLQTRDTALAEVSQVLGGECVASNRGKTTRTFYWNPLRIADSDVFEDPVEAATVLRHHARDCVQAWASCYDGILHTLSGGLDSSIVMACLQDAPSRPRITCVNYHSPDADGDERQFARLAALRAGQELIERERTASVSFEPLLSMHKTSAPPVTVLYYLENIRTEAQLAAEKSAQAIFTGNTGDQLFYQNSARFGAGDYISRHGIRPGLFNVALDAARMDRLSVWRVLRGAFADKLLGRQWSPLEGAGEFRQLLSAESLETARTAERFIHPLFRAPGRFPGGKLYHAYSLLFSPDFYPATGRLDDPELMAPLYSQPLIEVLLRTPVYLLTRGGWDRWTARRAFQHDVPREIITRQTKGGMEEHAKGIFLSNIGLVRELLLDGLLVSQGILDKTKLREVLSGGPTRLSPGTVELYDYFAAEAWARRWTGVLKQRVAA